MEEELFRQCIYRGPDDLLEDAQRKGLISFEFNELQKTILQSLFPEKEIGNALKIRVLNINGWITFLKDISFRTKNDDEYRFTDGLLIMFEEIMDKDSEQLCEECLNIKHEKKLISDDDIMELKKINYIQELLDPKNGFFK